MNRVFLKKLIKILEPKTILLTLNQKNMNGNATREKEDEDALKSNGNVDKNKSKVLGKK